MLTRVPVRCCRGGIAGVHGSALAAQWVAKVRLFANGCCPRLFDPLPHDTADPSVTHVLYPNGALTAAEDDEAAQMRTLQTS